METQYIQEIAMLRADNLQAVGDSRITAAFPATPSHVF
jgi:hypothetical protein